MCHRLPQDAYPKTFELLGALTGVSVSEGDHEIEIKYVPSQFYLGIGLSCVGIITLAGIYMTEKYGTNKLKEFLKRK